jgi:hypothetical protein
MVTTISLVGTRWRRCQGRGRLRPLPCACTCTLDSTSRRATRLRLGVAQRPHAPEGRGVRLISGGACAASDMCGWIVVVGELQHRPQTRRAVCAPLVGPDATVDNASTILFDADLWRAGRRCRLLHRRRPCV